MGVEGAEDICELCCHLEGSQLLIARLTEFLADVQVRVTRMFQRLLLPSLLLQLK